MREYRAKVSMTDVGLKEAQIKGHKFQNGDWVYGYYWSNGVDNHFIKITHIDIERKGNGFSYAESKYVNIDIEIDQMTLGQETGMRDMANRKIYEGDYVKDSHGIGVVAYNEKEGRYVVEDYKEYGNDCDTRILSFDKIAPEIFEVLGNIHDKEIVRLYYINGKKVDKYDFINILEITVKHVISNWSVFNYNKSDAIQELLTHTWKALSSYKSITLYGHTFEIEEREKR